MEIQPVATDGPPERRTARDEILDEAIRQFADRGYSGSRVDDVAAGTATTKRMIYYYFGSKEGLFAAALLTAIRRGAVRPPPGGGPDDPAQAITWLVRAILDRDEESPELVRLLAVGNIHHARHLRVSAELHGMAGPLVAWIAGVLRRGEERGVFRSGADPVDLLLAVHAVSGNRVVNREGTRVLTELDVTEPSVRERQREMLVDMVLGYLRA